MSILSARPNLDKVAPPIRICDHPSGQPCLCDDSGWLVEVDPADDYALAIAVANRRALGLPVDAKALAHARSAFGVATVTPLTDAEWWALQNRDHHVSTPTPVEVLDASAPFDFDATAVYHDCPGRPNALAMMDDAELARLIDSAGSPADAEFDRLAAERGAEERGWC